MTEESCQHAVRGKNFGLRTVDGNGDALVKNESISTLESGDLSEGVQLEVLSADSVELRVDDLDLKIVGLRNRKQSEGAGVVLQAAEKGQSVHVQSSQFRSATAGHLG